jgi:hypothetical protein
MFPMIVNGSQHAPLVSPRASFAPCSSHPKPKPEPMNLNTHLISASVFRALLFLPPRLIDMRNSAASSSSSCIPQLTIESWSEAHRLAPSKWHIHEWMHKSINVRDFSHVHRSIQSLHMSHSCFWPPFPSTSFKIGCLILFSSGATSSLPLLTFRLLFRPAKGTRTATVN